MGILACGVKLFSIYKSSIQLKLLVITGFSAFMIFSVLIFSFYQYTIITNKIITISNDKYEYRELINKTSSSLKDGNIAWRNILIKGDNEKTLYTNWLYISKTQGEIKRSINKLIIKSKNKIEIKNKFVKFLSLNEKGVKEKESLFMDYINHVNKEEISIFLDSNAENKVIKCIELITNDVNYALELKSNDLIEERRYIVFYGVLISIFVFVLSIFVYINLTKKNDNWTY